MVMATANRFTHQNKAWTIFVTNCPIIWLDNILFRIFFVSVFFLSFLRVLVCKRCQKQLLIMGFWPFNLSYTFSNYCRSYYLYTLFDLWFSYQWLTTFGFRFVLFSLIHDISYKQLFAIHFMVHIISKQWSMNTDKQSAISYTIRTHRHTER